MHRYCAALLLLAAALMARPAAAQWAFTEAKTPGGIPFVQLVMPGEKDQAIAVAWRDGTVVSSLDKVGLVALAPLAVGAGTPELSASDLAEALKDIQGGSFVGTRAQWAVANASAPEANFAKLMALFGDAITTPRFDDRDFRRLRDRIVASGQQRKDEPQQIAGRMFRRVLLGDTPYFRVMSGWPPDSSQRITKQDVIDWHRAIFAKEGMLVATAGPMSAESVGPQIDRMLGGLPEAGQQPKIEPPAMRNPGKLIVLERPVGQSIVITGGPTIPVPLKEAIARELGLAALNGLTGRLGSTVRGTLGATYNISGTLLPVTQSEALFAISTAVSNDKVKDTLSTIRAEYARFLADGVTADELAARKSAGNTAFAESMRRPIGVATTLRENLMRRRALDYPNQRQAMVDAITLEDVAAVLKKSLPPAPLTTIVVTPSAEGLEADCVIQAEIDLERCTSQAP